jgi:predicted nucleic acid-binding Zn ribbon protein
MRRTNTQTLGSILKEFFQENPMVAEKLAETRLINAWGKVLGHLTEKYTTGLYIRNKTLYVQLSSAVLRSELTMCREQLIRKLNDEAGMPVIEEIVFS